MIRGGPLVRLAVFLLLAFGACETSPERPSILLVTVDTLRADHLSAYGYPRETSPRIDALARDGVTFEGAVAPVPLTTPAFASLMTGRWPAALGVRGNGERLPDGPPTLAGILSGAGYQTAAFVSGFPLKRRLCGLDRGFAHYDDDMPDPRGPRPNVQRTAEHTTDAVLAWLEVVRREPFFLWVHYYDPHGDYVPPPPFDTMFRPAEPGPFVPLASIPKYQRIGATTDAGELIARYDGEIRRTDVQVGRLLDALAARGRLERTLVVVTADHGESLLEHGYHFDHGNELYEPSVRIPLVIAGPGAARGARVAGPVRTPDVMPTVLELLRVARPDGIAGESFAGAVRTGAPVSGREGFSEARFRRYRAHVPGADVGPKVAARDDRFSAILRLGSSRLEVYDRRADPGETADLAPALEPGLSREIADALRRRLAALAAGRADSVVFTPPIRSRLEASAHSTYPSERSASSASGSSAGSSAPPS